MLPCKGVFMAVDFAYYRDIYGGKGEANELHSRKQTESAQGGQ